MFHYEIASNANAIELAQAAQRPWIGVSNVMVTEQYFVGLRFKITGIRCDLRNFGLSPARRVLLKFMPPMGQPAPQKKLADYCQSLKREESRYEHPLYVAAPEEGMAIFPDTTPIPKSDKHYNFAPSTPWAGFHVVVCVSYQSMFDDKWHHTYVLYTSSPIKDLYHDLPSPEELEMIPWDSFAD